MKRNVCVLQFNELEEMSKIYQKQSTVNHFDETHSSCNSTILDKHIFQEKESNIRQSILTEKNGSQLFKEIPVQSLNW